MNLETLRRKLNGQRPLDNADEGPPIVAPALEPGPSPTGLVGPRGRDESGESVVIPAGVPPIEIPGGGHPERFTPKEDAWPFPKPYLVTRPGFTLLSALPIDVNAAHPIRCIIVDNLSSQWIYFPAAARYVAPFLEHVCFPVSSAPQSLRVIAEAPPGFTQPGAAAGTGISVSAVEVELPFSPGIPVQGQGGAPAGGGTIVQGDVTLSDLISASSSNAILAGAAELVYNPSTGLLERVRTPTFIASGTVSGTAYVTIHTPPAGKKFRVLEWRYELVGNAASTPGADGNVIWGDGGVDVDRAAYFTPTVAGGTFGIQEVVPFRENGYLSTAANNALGIRVDNALSSGFVRVTAYGDDE